MSINTVIRTFKQFGQQDPHLHLIPQQNFHQSPNLALQKFLILSSSYSHDRMYVILHGLISRVGTRKKRDMD